MKAETRPVLLGDYECRESIKSAASQGLSLSSLYWDTKNQTQNIGLGPCSLCIVFCCAWIKIFDFQKFTHFEPWDLETLVGVHHPCLIEGTNRSETQPIEKHNHANTTSTTVAQMQPPKSTITTRENTNHLALSPASGQWVRHSPTNMFIKLFHYEQYLHHDWQLVW